MFLCLKRHEMSPFSPAVRRLKHIFLRKSRDSPLCFPEPRFGFPTFVRTYATTLAGALDLLLVKCKVLNILDFCLSRFKGYFLTRRGGLRNTASTQYSKAFFAIFTNPLKLLTFVQKRSI